MHMFLKSKCKGKSDLGVCMTSVLVNRMRLRSADFRRILRPNTFLNCLLPATLLERWPQVCRVKITFELLPNSWFVSTKMNSMKCFVNWIPLNTHVLSNQTQRCLNSRTNIILVLPNVVCPPARWSGSRFLSVIKLGFLNQRKKERKKERTSGSQ